MNEDVRNELGHQIDDDGVFYMTIEQAYLQFNSVSMNYDTEGWHQSFFLAIDDDLSGSTQGSWNWCGETCTRYNGWIKNTSG